MLEDTALNHIEKLKLNLLESIQKNVRQKFAQMMRAREPHLTGMVGREEPTALMRWGDTI
jgi:hypothetical protein